VLIITTFILTTLLIIHIMNTGYGSHMSFAKLVEQKPCVLQPFETTKAINEWRSVGRTPFADRCGNFTEV
jgi:hypothetical protein